MYKVPDNIQEVYKDSDKLRIRLKLAEDNFRDEIKNFSPDRQKEILERFYVLWGQALETWIWPDEEDLKKLL